MKVEELDDLIEGYSTAFDEDSKLKIFSQISALKELTFDETFGNIAFKVNQVHNLSNPIQSKFHSA